MKDIVETLLATEGFATLCNALRAADVVKTYKAAGPFTLFAPTDEAFRKLPIDALEELLHDRARLREVISHHVLRGMIKTWDFSHGNARTLAGSTVRIGANDDGPTIGNANVMQRNVVASNGVIHTIDLVLTPGESAAARHPDEPESPWAGKRQFAPLSHR